MKKSIPIVILLVFFLAIALIVMRQNGLLGHSNEKTNENSDVDSILTGTDTKDGNGVQTADESKSQEIEPADNHSTGVIPENTEGRVGLGEEFVYDGIGCTIKSVTLTDLGDDFTEVFPEYSDKSKWRDGVSSTFEQAKWYTDIGMGDTKFDLEPEYRLIMEVSFHNYYNSRAYSLFLKPNYELDGSFCDSSGNRVANFSFMPDYNSMFTGNNKKGVHNFKIPANGDYEAIFIMTVHPVVESTETVSDKKKLKEFYGDGDVLIYAQRDIKRFIRGERDFPYIQISESEIIKKLYGKYTKEDFVRTRKTYQQYYEEHAGNQE